MVWCASSRSSVDIYARVCSLSAYAIFLYGFVRGLVVAFLFGMVMSYNNDGFVNIYLYEEGF